MGRRRRRQRIINQGYVNYLINFHSQSIGYCVWSIRQPLVIIITLLWLFNAVQDGSMDGL